MTRFGNVVRSFVDPATYFQVVRLLHYYSYSHVRPRRLLTIGAGSTIAPNISICNPERITIGAGTKIGERACLWAGDTSGKITIGDNCRFGPEVFLTASNYGLSPADTIAGQARDERDIVIGNDVWLGVRVFVGAGVEIGDGTVVSAGSVVTKSLPPGSIATGVPARIVRRREDYGSATATDAAQDQVMPATEPAAQLADA